MIQHRKGGPCVLPRWRETLHVALIYAAAFFSSLGFFILASCITGPRPLRGDANCDGHLDCRDVQMIMERVTGYIPIEDVPCPELADYSRDGTLSAWDAALIRRDPAYEDCSPDSAILEGM